VRLIRFISAVSIQIGQVLLPIAAVFAAPWLVGRIVAKISMPDGWATGWLECTVLGLLSMAVLGIALIIGSLFIEWLIEQWHKTNKP
jgi:hypothetical protein